MMTKHEGCKRQFHHTSKAWYGSTCFNHVDYCDEIMVGMYHPDGGTSGEFSIRWVSVGGKFVPQLAAFDDAWDALTHFTDVIHALATLDDQNATSEMVADLLVKCGVENATETERAVL